jgi:hypothetical protein
MASQQYMRGLDAAEENAPRGSLYGGASQVVSRDVRRRSRCSFQRRLGRAMACCGIQQAQSSPHRPRAWSLSALHSVGSIKEAGGRCRCNSRHRYQGTAGAGGGR